MLTARSLGLTLAPGRDVGARAPSLRTLLRHLSPRAPPAQHQVVELQSFEEMVMWLRRGAMVANVADGMLLPPGQVQPRAISLDLADLLGLRRTRRGPSSI